MFYIRQVMHGSNLQPRIGESYIGPISDETTYDSGTDSTTATEDENCLRDAILFPCLSVVSREHMKGWVPALAFFPKVVSDILSFLPFSSLIYTPVMIIVGKYDANQILQALALQFFWLLVMVGLSQLIWKRVQSFITIQGG